MKKIEEWFWKHAWWLVISLSLLLIFGTILWLVYVRGGWPTVYPKEITKWGVFGDYFGGILSALLGFMSLVILSYTLRFQQKSSEQQLNLTITAYEFQVLMAQISQLEISRKRAEAINTNGERVYGDFILNNSEISAESLESTFENKAYINILKTCKRTIQMLEPKHAKLCLSIMLTERERDYK